MNKSAKTLLFYLTLFSAFILISSIVANPQPQVIFAQLFFLPVVVFLLVESVKVLQKHSKTALVNLNRTTFLIISTVLILFIISGVKSINNPKNVENGKESASVMQLTSTSKPDIQVTPTPQLPQITIDSKGYGFVNVRLGPSTSTPIIMKVNDGDVFSIYDDSFGWYKIATQSGKFGYISKTYANTLKQASGSGQPN